MTSDKSGDIARMSVLCTPAVTRYSLELHVTVPENSWAKVTVRVGVRVTLTNASVAILWSSYVHFYRMAPCDYSPLANDLAELEINVKSKSAVLISESQTSRSKGNRTRRIRKAT